MRKLVRGQDAAWLALMAGLGFASPVRSSAEIQLLVALALFQVVEPKVGALQTHAGVHVAIFLRLLLCYLLIGVTGGVSSSYYLILMVPVVSAATALGAVGTLVVSLIAGGSYLSFLLLLDWSVFVIPPDQMRELLLRVLMFGVLAFLTHQLAAASRRQSRQYMETAEQLARANQSLQEAEAAVRRSERLAALGQLTAGLAHELRNPLGTMRASADVLLKNVGPDQTVARELAGYIVSEVERTNSLITRFLDFARPLELRLAPADIGETIDRVIAQLERQQPPLGVTVYRNYSPEVRPIPLDRELMEGVFYNLILNAVQASAEGGTVTVKTRPLGAGVEVSVIDRGVGIAEGQKENIFNPFVTTKATGVGLGLAIVAKIVDQHKGKITVESEPGQGSIFHVYLPGAA
ncbi:MAG: hypothetical protein JJE04_03475 [Acidobacteriia bacterium]|nr:hypothetical protein [Terriglobia bacterium]